MTDHEKDLVSDLVRTKHGGETVFPLKVVESKHGYWINADIWVGADELVRVQRQTIQDAGSSLQGDEGKNDMNKYEVTVTLHIEAESKEQADNRAYAIVNFGGCNEEYLLGWDLEEIVEMS